MKNLYKIVKNVSQEELEGRAGALSPLDETLAQYIRVSTYSDTNLLYIKKKAIEKIVKKKYLKKLKKLEKNRYKNNPNYDEYDYWHPIITEILKQLKILEIDYGGLYILIFDFIRDIKK